ncbi:MULTISPECIES: hypothetical protein [Mammaliicoccus]|uniref:hypothetical protein n=1 Tax=Mammaliicoccus TaxID=2803850 RepID=UPI0002D73EEC|nr:MULTISPECIES: hypothetical protein [Mammaliicoccus]
MNEPLNIILWGVAIFVVLMLLSYLLPILILGIVGIANLFVIAKEHRELKKAHKKAFEERRKSNLETRQLEREKFDGIKEKVESELNKHF